MMSESWGWCRKVDGVGEDNVWSRLRVEQASVMAIWSVHFLLDFIVISR